MDPITAARNEYEAAKAAHDTARKAMVARAKANRWAPYDPAERKAVDALHKVMSQKYQAWWQLSHAAA